MIRLRRPRISKVTELEGLLVVKAKGARAVYLGPDCEEIEVTLGFEDGQVATMRLSPDAGGALCTSIAVAYEAIRPRLSTGWGPGTWKGM